MKRTVKILGIVLLTTVVLMTTVFATVGSRTAELLYNNIKIMINGKEIVPTDANGNAVEPFTIDGTTYLPVRAIASALGMTVGWDDATKTVTLDNPGVFSGAVQVYDDEFVTIEFAGCREKKGYSSTTYYADFNIKNKTDVELTFQPGAFAINGFSYQFSGSEEVAPQSTGRVSFTNYDGGVPTGGVSVTSGQISVIDFDYREHELFGLKQSYKAEWLNITKE